VCPAGVFCVNDSEHTNGITAIAAAAPRMNA
jgi:hypothetical protein